jgi:hypothetical protein
LSIETYLAGDISIQKFFDRDSNLKIFLLPGLDAQKVEKHCHRVYIGNNKYCDKNSNFNQNFVKEIDSFE